MTFCHGEFTSFVLSDLISCVNWLAVSVVWNVSVHNGCDQSEQSRSRSVLVDWLQPQQTGSFHSAFTATQFRWYEVSWDKVRWDEMRDMNPPSVILFSVSHYCDCNWSAYLPYLGVELVGVYKPLKWVTHSQCDARPLVTFLPSQGHRCPVTGTKLFRLVTEAHMCVWTTCQRSLLGSWMAGS